MTEKFGITFYILCVFQSAAIDIRYYKGLIILHQICLMGSERDSDIYHLKGYPNCLIYHEIKH